MSDLGIIYKTRVAEDDDRAPTPPARTASAKSTSEMSWHEWVDERMEALSAACGQALAQYVGEKVDPLARDLELTRRELKVLREEVALERGLRALRAEVAEARAQVPKLPAIVARLKAKQADLEAELATTKGKLGRLRVDQSISDYNFRELRKRMDASASASIEMEFESASSHFQMKATHPQAAAALKEFAAGIISGQADGTIWLPGSAGTAS